MSHAELERVLRVAQEEADRLSDEYISTEHLLLGVLETRSEASDLLRGEGVDKDALIWGDAEIKTRPREAYAAVAVLLKLAHLGGTFVCGWKGRGRRGGRGGGLALHFTGHGPAARVARRHGRLADTSTHAGQQRHVLA